MAHTLPAIHTGSTVRIGGGETDWSVVALRDGTAELCSAAGAWRTIRTDRLTPAPTLVPDPYDPWEHLLRYEGLGWRLILEDLGVDGPLGLTSWPDRTIRLTTGMVEDQQRSVLAHELVHVERGPSHRVSHGVPDDEREVCETAALRLITFDALVEAAQWATTYSELADELNVDALTVQTRVSILTKGQRTTLRRACPQGINPRR